MSLDRDKILLRIYSNVDLPVSLSNRHRRRWLLFRVSS